MFGQYSVHVPYSGGDERTTVTWTQDGHTCAIVAPSEVPAETLVELSGRSLLAWQLLRLQAAGVEEAVIVTGFRADAVEAEADGVTSEEIIDAIHPHPTMSEAVGEAHLALAGKPLHVHG